MLSGEIINVTYFPLLEAILEVIHHGNLKQKIFYVYESKNLVKRGPFKRAYHTLSGVVWHKITCTLLTNSWFTTINESFQVMIYRH